MLVAPQPSLWCEIPVIELPINWNKDFDFPPKYPCFFNLFIHSPLYVRLTESFCCMEFSTVVRKLLIFRSFQYCYQMYLVSLYSTYTVSSGLHRTTNKKCSMKWERERENVDKRWVGRQKVWNITSEYDYNTQGVWTIFESLYEGDKLNHKIIKYI